MVMDDSGPDLVMPVIMVIVCIHDGIDVDHEGVDDDHGGVGDDDGDDDGDGDGVLDW